MYPDKELSVICSPDGTARSLYSDALNIFDHGKATVCRVTDVEFDNDTQDWVATIIKTGQEIARGKSRENVLEIEAIVVSDLLFLGHNLQP